MPDRGYISADNYMRHRTGIRLFRNSSPFLENKTNLTESAVIEQKERTSDSVWSGLWSAD